MNKNTLVKSFLIMIFILFFFYLIKSAQADEIFVNDYSNDFENEIAAKYNHPSVVTGFDIDESPIVRFQRAIDDINQREVNRKLNRQIKYTYRPLSPDKKQYRKMIGVEDD